MEVSAKVLPRQIRLPPKNGVKARGFRGFPSAALLHLLSGSVKSNRSG
jgi:hypothetical protein